MKPDLHRMLGNRVRIVIDRPIGTKHPKYKLTVYPINCGFIPKTISGDGREVDVYVLGVTEALKPFTELEVDIIALIIRDNDQEDKLVGSLPGRQYTEAEIIEQLEFQEKFFQSRVIMPKKDSSKLPES
jgi:inorganic pyrophosphatase